MAYFRLVKIFIFFVVIVVATCSQINWKQLMFHHSLLWLLCLKHGKQIGKQPYKSIFLPKLIADIGTAMWWGLRWDCGIWLRFRTVFDFDLGPFTLMPTSGWRSNALLRNTRRTCRRHDSCSDSASTDAESRSRVQSAGHVAEKRACDATTHASGCTRRAFPEQQATRRRQEVR